MEVFCARLPMKARFFMRVLVTCGPTYEPLDQVRRLTNFSAGKLGLELGNFLTDRGHETVLLQGYYSTYRKPSRASQVIGFTTTDNLLLRFRELAPLGFDAVFHAAAVSDFQFGKVFRQIRDGTLETLSAGKYSTRSGTLLTELLPAPKIISELRSLYPSAKLFGWKFEVDGTREQALASGEKQIRDNRTDYCVVNGPAYGEGYGVVDATGMAEHLPLVEDLYEKLAQILSA
jgi:phosphopantothenoylcysteine decarboxylase/phosphopantothenate--cysteine ligase